jgi:hypothetical protein
VLDAVEDDEIWGTAFVIVVELRGISSGLERIELRQAGEIVIESGEPAEPGGVRFELYPALGGRGGCWWFIFGNIGVEGGRCEEAAVLVGDGIDGMEFAVSKKSQVVQKKPRSPPWASYSAWAEDDMSARVTRASQKRERMERWGLGE